MKGQELHWPEMPEARLLSTTPVVLQQNSHGVFCGEQLLGKRKLLLHPGYVFLHMMYGKDMALENCVSALPVAHNQMGKCALDC